MREARMSTDSHMHELLRYFIETTSLQMHPDNTRTYRVVVLRLLYSVGNIDIEESIRRLHENGVYIGEYDAITTVGSLFQKLTTMQIEDWIALMRYVVVEHIDRVFEEVHAAYDDAIMDSPLWNLKSTFEVFARVGVHTLMGGCLLGRGACICSESPCFCVWGCACVCAKPLCSECVNLTDHYAHRSTRSTSRRTQACWCTCFYSCSTGRLTAVLGSGLS